jgi:prepilin-type N-terminal cleavage/methylation domain-containing protein
MKMSPSPRGFTLVEMIVAIAVMALSGAVATVAFRGLLRPHSEGLGWEAQRRQSRRMAVQEGIVLLTYPDSAPDEPVLFLPDGRVIGDGVDPLTGRQVRP